jgi:hypothetical protein
MEGNVSLVGIARRIVNKELTLEPMPKKVRILFVLLALVAEFVLLFARVGYLN